MMDSAVLNRTTATVTLLVGLVASALGQVPDVSIKLDAWPTYRAQNGSDSSFRWYDLLGHQTLVSLAFRLEPGYRAFVSQRFQRPDNDGDGESLDEYYVEDPDYWRIGKQQLPFGSGKILRESVRAARVNTSLVIEALPISIAACDSGSDGRTRGVIGRLGEKIGVSAAFGENFGIASSALTCVRRPEDAPGPGRGYKVALGADCAWRLGSINMCAEWVGLRQGHTALDPDNDIAQVSATLWKSDVKLQASWARSFVDHADYFVFGSSAPITKNLTLESSLRYRSSSFHDFSLTMHVSL